MLVNYVERDPTIDLARSGASSNTKISGVYFSHRSLILYRIRTIRKYAARFTRRPVPCQEENRFSKEGLGQRRRWATGKHIDTINVPERPRQLSFGGSDLRTLFIAARTSLELLTLSQFWIDVGATGNPLSIVAGLCEEQIGIGCGSMSRDVKGCKFG